MKSAQCPPVPLLRRYVHGDLNEAEADTIDQHLSQCARCLEQLDHLSQTDTLVSVLRARTPPHETPPALHQAVHATVALHAARTISGETVVGGYTLHEEIGRGGMGHVFRATHPRLPVEVAIKLLRPGHDSDYLRRRFESEREVLSRMDHPNIARVFDAGLSEDDRPFIVMEYIRGTTLTGHLKNHDIPWRDKLNLFQSIASAIQHAHQKGVIHRDIKPSNILITEYDGRPVPKVIDFGVARAIDPSVNRHTEDGFAVGTLQYMSPEQTQNLADAIDTGTDIYSLGVLLYELMAGQTPLAALGAQKKPPLEAMRFIRDIDPPPLSRFWDGDRSTRRISRELDWITQRTLEKEPSRRYQTVAALGEDIRRLLADEPILAAPPSRTYQLRKFARRHRPAIIGTALVLLALCAGMITTTIQLYRARDAETQALQSANDANAKRILAENAETNAKRSANEAKESARTTEAFAEFLMSRFLATARPKGIENGLGIKVTVAEALEEAEKTIEVTFKDQPRAEAETRLSIGVTWRNLGRMDASLRNLKRAIDLMTAEFGAEAVRTLTARSEYAHSLFFAGSLEESKAIFLTTIPLIEARLGADDTLTLRVRAIYSQTLTARRLTAEEGLSISRTVYEIAQKKWGEDHDFVRMARTQLAAGLFQLGQYDEGLAFSQPYLAHLQATRKPDDAVRLRAEYQKAQVLTRDNKSQEGIVELERLIPLMSRTLGSDHIDTITATSVLCAGYAKNGRVTDAIRMGEPNVQRADLSLGRDHPKTLHALFVLGLSYIIAQKGPESKKLTEDYSQRIDAHLPPLSTAVTYATIDLVALLSFTKDYQRIVTHGERVLASGVPEVDAKTLQTMKVLTLAYVQLDRFEDAETMCQRQIKVFESRTPPDLKEISALHYLMAECQLKAKDYMLAESHIREAIKAYEVTDPKGIMNPICQSVLGEVLMHKKRYPESETALLAAHEGLKVHESRRPRDPRWLINTQQCLARLIKLYTALQKSEETKIYRALLSKTVTPAKKK